MGIFLIDKLAEINKWIHFCKDRFRKGRRQVIVKERVNGGFGGEWPQSPEERRSQGHLLLGGMAM